MKAYQLKRDIVVPRGTIMYPAPSKTERYGDDHYDAIVGLSKDTSGSFEYCIDVKEQLDEWFQEIDIPGKVKVTR